jgi:hypothetical protein
MRLCLASDLYKLTQVRLARLECGIRQLSTEQLVSQPDTVGVDDITLAVSSNLVDPTISMLLLDLSNSCHWHAFPPLAMNADPC